MRLNKGFALRQVAQIWVVLPLGEKTVDFSGMLTLNDSGAMLWKVLENGGDQDALVAALTAEYEVSEAQARTDVEEFLAKLIRAGCIDQEA